LPNIHQKIEATATIHFFNVGEFILLFFMAFALLVGNSAHINTVVGISQSSPELMARIERTRMNWITSKKVMTKKNVSI
jgi:hypothetical protein